MLHGVLKRCPHCVTQWLIGRSICRNQMTMEWIMHSTIAVHDGLSSFGVDRPNRAMAHSWSPGHGDLYSGIVVVEPSGARGIFRVGYDVEVLSTRQKCLHARNFVGGVQRHMNLSKGMSVVVCISIGIFSQSPVLHVHEMLSIILLDLHSGKVVEFDIIEGFAEWLIASYPGSALHVWSFHFGDGSRFHVGDALLQSRFFNFHVDHHSTIGSSFEFSLIAVDPEWNCPVGSRDDICLPMSILKNSIVADIEEYSTCELDGMTLEVSQSWCLERCVRSDLDDGVFPITNGPCWGYTDVTIVAG
mmetsp:Transcript_19456/g.40989  ORF Transcript_19456/g.40989 Transcript_19456/m.40989 type:complete len:302 (+) Transcript_19456:317-1222(+)